MREEVDQVVRSLDISFEELSFFRVLDSLHCGVSSYLLGCAC